MRTRRRKKKTGSKALPASVVRWGVVCLLLFALFSVTSVAARGADKKNKNKQQDSYSIVAGTVFRDPGFALSGARITMVPAPEPAKASKLKKIKAVVDSRGEFAFRVPAEPMRYLISAEANGYASQEKQIVVQAAERIEVYFTLQPVSR
jgi:hypothetical protein